MDQDYILYKHYPHKFYSHRIHNQIYIKNSHFHLNQFHNTYNNHHSIVYSGWLMYNLGNFCYRLYTLGHHNRSNVDKRAFNNTHNHLHMMNYSLECRLLRRILGILLDICDSIVCVLCRRKCSLKHLANKYGSYLYNLAR